MHFFLYEIVARVVAIYLCVDCYRQLKIGLAERKIAYRNTDLLEWLFIDWSKYVVQREAAPVRYWMEIGLRINILVACVVVAICGWWQPNA